MRLSIRKYSVTTPQEVFRCKVEELHNFNIHGDAAFQVGDDTLVLGSGEPVSAGGNWGYTHQDFRPDASGDLVVYAGSSVGANIYVTSWLVR
jgi:hypothetical protein